MLLLVERGHVLGLPLPLLSLQLILSARLSTELMLVIHLVVFTIFKGINIVAFHEWYWVKLLLIFVLILNLKSVLIVHAPLRCCCYPAEL